ncbi:MAG TPA: prephenate dehydrogenase/arogenate dehydrogenase family protein [Bacteroidota bacterium]|nr:prephenate dehydrogenase/arogenate dehydrogenase family protein [Bacteroidota bacterium]
MNIVLLGTGRMGSWLAHVLAGDHRVTVCDVRRRKAEAIAGVQVADSAEAACTPPPDLLINAVGLRDTLTVYRSVLPHLAPSTMLCDLASVKTDLPEFYRSAGHRFVSVHPMFGPTFADLTDLRNENAVIIADSDDEGKDFFSLLFRRLGAHIFHYSFEEHDRMMAYSLTLPFVSSLVFLSCVNARTVPGTTFRRHLEVARGLLSEDEFLLSEILFNPHSLAQIERINNKLNFLWHIVRNRDSEEARSFINDLRKRLEPE